LFRLTRFGGKWRRPGYRHLMPSARNADSSGISSAWYRARGWWGGRALNQGSYQRPDTGRTLSN
jgi:hypothetical protein